MEKLQEFIPLIVTILTALGTILGMMSKIVKDTKTKKALAKAADVLNKTASLADEVTVLMKIAEDSGKSGKEKHDTVLSKAKEIAAALGLKLDDGLTAYIESIIKNQIEFSKKVNYKAKASDLPKPITNNLKQDSR